MKSPENNSVRRLFRFICAVGIVSILIATYPYNIPKKVPSTTTTNTATATKAEQIVKSTGKTGETDKFERIFYYAPRFHDLAMTSLRENQDKIDILAPQTYVITDNLTASGTVPAQIKEAIRGSEIKLMPLIANDNFSQDLIHRFLASPESQSNLIKFLIREAGDNGYIGWQFDIEHILYTDRDAYSRFIEQTKLAFEPYGLTLSVAAVSRINDEQSDFYKNWSGAFDYTRLAKSVDFISIMTYDDPDKIGPTASMPFVRGVYAYVKDKIPTEKLSLGIPLYFWNWSINPLKRVKHEGTYDQMMVIKAQNSYTEGYNTNYGVPYVSYYNQGKRYVLWYEDDRSIKEKLDFARENNLRGFSAWVLGIENPKIWSAIN